jgi:hypothetical protein
MYKIGQSKCLTSRLCEFNVFPGYWELVWFIESDNSRSLETEFHRKYADKRVIGEWFKLTDEDVKEIKAHGLNPDDGKIETMPVSAKIPIDIYGKFRHYIVDEQTTRDAKINELIEQWVVKKEAGLL